MLSSLVKTSTETVHSNLLFNNITSIQTISYIPQTSNNQMILLFILVNS